MQQQVVGIDSLYAGTRLGQQLGNGGRGLAGGLVGGRLFRCVSVEWLRGLFAAFLVYGGVRYLL